MSSSELNSTALANRTGNVAPSNATEASSAPQATSVLFANWDFLFLTAQVTASAMVIIWLGSNSSVRRPPSAAPATVTGKGKKKAKEDGFSEGFTASDAILVPLLAGTVLVGLYYLIKWMQDPDLLNKILRAYMSVMSVASLGKLAADALHLLTNLAFPNVWSDRSGRIFQMDTVRRQQILLSADSAPDAFTLLEKKTPFPGLLSRVSFSERTNKGIWEFRNLLTEEWSVRVAVHGLGSGHVEIKLNDVLGVFVALLATITYYTTGWVWLSNVLGAAFCYAAFTMISPTSFVIGTMVLVGLFVYDIVMVFYTPYMVTVATKLDVPIKLVFQGPSRSSILGLGDIVVPGIFIGLALRFDLWRHYNKQIKSVPTELKTEFTDETKAEAVTTTQTQYRQVKIPFVDPRGQWGDRLWSATGLGSLFSAPTATPALAATSFSKTYFYTSMVGYALGMVFTLTMLLVFKRGQPALLYLVPCVTGAVWVTGAVRGEIRDMITYTEDGSLDMEDVVVEVDGSGKAIVEKSEKATQGSDPDGGSVRKRRGDTSSAVSAGTVQLEERDSHKGPEDSESDGSYDVFRFSITAPGPPSLKDD